VWRVLLREIFAISPDSVRGSGLKVSISCPHDQLRRVPPGNFGNAVITEHVNFYTTRCWEREERSLLDARTPFGFSSVHGRKALSGHLWPVHQFSRLLHSRNCLTASWVHLEPELLIGRRVGLIVTSRLAENRGLQHLFAPPPEAGGCGGLRGAWLGIVQALVLGHHQLIMACVIR
jgi:hypothetical protein